MIFGPERTITLLAVVGGPVLMILIIMSFLAVGNKISPHEEPFFKIYIYMVLNDYHKLRNYERMLHLAGHDTMNRPGNQ